MVGSAAQPWQQRRSVIAGTYGPGPAAAPWGAAGRLGRELPGEGGAAQSPSLSGLGPWWERAFAGLNPAPQSGLQRCAVLAAPSTGPQGQAPSYLSCLSSLRGLPRLV